MPAKLIDGKKLAESILLEVKKKAAKIKNKPGLAAILVGDNEASKLYLKLKEKACQEADINFSNYILGEDCNEQKVIEGINFLNQDPQINGIMVQLPLPKKFETEKIINAIDPQKDIDGFHPQTKFISPNVLGIIALIKSTGTDLKSKNISILSNSEIFSLPFKKLLKSSEVKYLNPNDKDLAAKTGQADVLIVALGKPKYIKPEMVKKDAILIDVGINKVPASAKATAGKDGKTVGDIDPECDKIASWRSPVPGGVGPMTVAMLLKNLVDSAK